MYQHRRRWRCSWRKHRNAYLDTQHTVCTTLPNKCKFASTVTIRYEVSRLRWQSSVTKDLKKVCSYAVDPAGSQVPAECPSKHNTGLNSITGDNLFQQISDHQLLIKLVLKNSDCKDDLRLLKSWNLRGEKCNKSSRVDRCVKVWKVTLKMATQSAPEKLENFQNSTQLSAREDFIGPEILLLLWRTIGLHNKQSLITSKSRSVLKT
jgi:hypothetical protein